MDSRRERHKYHRALKSGFWGIVWTAGDDCYIIRIKRQKGFWGIVWTAGFNVAYGLDVPDKRFWGIVWTAGLGVFNFQLQNDLVFGG